MLNTLSPGANLTLARIPVDGRLTVRDSQAAGRLMLLFPAVITGHWGRAADHNGGQAVEERDVAKRGTMLRHA